MPASETGRQKKQEGSVKMPARNEAQHDEDDSHLCSDSSGKVIHVCLGYSLRAMCVLIVHYVVRTVVGSGPDLGDMELVVTFQAIYLAISSAVNWVKISGQMVKDGWQNICAPAKP
ncbi:unnamed protein product [Caretta caretta]